MSTHRRPAADLAAVVAGGGALAGSWLIASGDRPLPEWEVVTFEYANGLPDWLFPVLWVPMQSGNYPASMAVSVATGAVARDARLGLAALVGSQLAYWSAKGIKEIVGRGRPATFLGEVRLRENADDQGYVSGHAAVAFALATAVGPDLRPAGRALLGATASAAALGRVYVGVHLPADVLGGAGLGVLAGTLARRITAPRGRPSRRRR